MLPMGVTGVTYPVKIPKFITRNTKLIFENPDLQAYEFTPTLALLEFA